MFAFVNNNFIKSDDAKISIDERGFKYGDGFFDTIIINNYQPFNWLYHKRNIIRNLSFLNIKYDIQELESICKKLIAINQFKQGLLRIYFSAGIGSNGFLRAKNLLPSLVVECINQQQRFQKSHILYISKYNKIPNECLPSNIKYAGNIQSVIIKEFADKNKCIDGVLLHNNYICECSSSNIFWIKDNQIYSPSTELPCYPGSIRDAITKLDLEITFGKYKINDLTNADAVFITNVGIKIHFIESILGFDTIYRSNNIINQIQRKLQDYIKKTTKQKVW